MLLDLPAELIQLVLKHCSISAYLQAALSCRTLYTIASSSRDVILHHIQTNPGPGFISQQITQKSDGEEAGRRLSTRELFSLLRRGASEHLLYGNVDYDRTIYTFDDKVIDISASSLCNEKDQKAIALVFKGDDKIYHCPAGADGRIRVENTQTCSLPLLMPFINAERVSIVKSTYATSHQHLLGVLVKAEEHGSGVEDKDVESSVPSFFNQELQREREKSQNVYFMLFLETVIRHEPEFGRLPHSIYELQAEDGFKVNAVAALNDQYFATSWEQTNGKNHNVDMFKADWGDGPMIASRKYPFTPFESTRFLDERGLWVVGRDSEKMERSHHQEVSALGAVAELKFNDQRQLLHTHRGSAMFGYYQNFGFVHAMQQRFVPLSAHRNYANVRMGESLEMSFAVEIPFYASHDTETDTTQGGPLCYWKYLSYGISTDRIQGRTMACLFIAHATVNGHRCTHQTFLERGRRLPRWLPVARLCDYPDSSVSTIGCRFAVSPNGTRIAVMQWDTLYIWALNPKEVIGFDKSNYYPEPWLSGDRMDGDDMIELRPVILHIEAVCFKLMFTENDDVIVGLTDRGLMTWDLRPQARRRRSTVNINLEQVPCIERRNYTLEDFNNSFHGEEDSSSEDRGGSADDAENTEDESADDMSVDSAGDMSVDLVDDSTGDAESPEDSADDMSFGSGDDSADDLSD